MRKKSAQKVGACAELLNLAGTWDKKRAHDFLRQLREIRGKALKNLLTVRRKSKSKPVDVEEVFRTLDKKYGLVSV